jgi:TPP-dependent pyruvate/acetoin dehydrogenase alpha subunit
MIGQPDELTESGRDLDGLAPAQVREALQRIIAARVFDAKAVAMHRRGKLGTYPPCAGQEASFVGAALALDRERDWVVPQYREIPLLVAQGVPLESIILYYMGDPAGGWWPGHVNALPFQISIAAQLPQAVGIAWGLKLSNTGGAVLACVGDGGTSEGDFHESVNLAGVQRCPVVFFVSNNGWAISTPRARQSAAPSLAERAAGYGLEGVTVDGNDLPAVHRTVRAALDEARAGRPVIVESLTYRMGPHSTVDDPRVYRSEDELAPWRENDGFERLARRAREHGLWSDADEAAAHEAAAAAVDEAFAHAQAAFKPAPRQLGEHVGAHLPAQTAAQLQALERRERGERA